MANLEVHDTHNMVAYLKKTEGSEGFHHIFWQTATARTLDTRDIELTAIIDGKVKIITEASVRMHLQLADSEGIRSLPTTEIFEQLSLMRHVSTSDKLTFQKGHFSPQWRFLIHTILHCLSPKKTSWQQFSSNIAIAIICLATNRKFNFSKLIFDGMGVVVQGEGSTHPETNQQESVVPQPRSPSQTLIADEAASIGVDVRYGGAATTVTGLKAGQGSGNIDKTPTMPYDSPLPRVNTLGSDEGSMTLQELMVFYTQMLKKVESLEADLKQTNQAKRRARIVVSDDEEDLEDPSKHGKKIDEIDQDPDISLVQHDAEIHGRYGHDMEFETDFDAVKEVSTTKDVSTAKPVSIVGAVVTTASVAISTASPPRVSTADDITLVEALVYIRRSAAKDKGKAKMGQGEGSTTSVVSPTQSLVADEAAFTGVDVRYGGATTTIIGLEVGHGSELMVFCITLSKNVESLETNLKQTKLTYGAAYTKLIKKVKKLENKVKSSQARRRVRIIVFDDEDDLENPSKQGRKIAEIDQDPAISLHVELDFDLDTAKDVSTAKPVSIAGAAVTTASVAISTASPPRVSTADDITLAEALVYIRRSAAKDKAKLKEEKRQRIAMVHEEASSFNVEEWEDIQARVEADEELAQRVQAEEREKYTKAEQARMLVELINQRKKYFAAQRAKERRNKPLTQAQQRALLDDLVMLWSLVKEKLNSTEPTYDKEIKIWVELKILFEPDIDDELWKLQKHIHDLTWKLYDSCGVHHVSTEKGINIYMLVEKEYTLSRGTLTLMLGAKLLVEQDNEMFIELLRKIFMQAERPRK
ncbi:hypothetical protein Tco_0236364 [Tanacetum coccineum]